MKSEPRLVLIDAALGFILRVFLLRLCHQAQHVGAVTVKKARLNIYCAFRRHWQWQTWGPISGAQILDIHHLPVFVNHQDEIDTFHAVAVTGDTASCCLSFV